MESINGLISSFRFMLEDEIAFALTQATPISQHILAKVNKHFHSSELSEMNLTISLFQVTQKTNIVRFVHEQDLISFPFPQVAAHIEASKDKPGCVLQPVPLHFVFGSEKSLAIFHRMFSQLSLPGKI
jgi:hypothetical protein